MLFFLDRKDYCPEINDKKNVKNLLVKKVWFYFLLLMVDNRTGKKYFNFKERESKCSSKTSKTKNYNV